MKYLRPGCLALMLATLGSGANADATIIVQCKETTDAAWLKRPGVPDKTMEMPPPKQQVIKLFLRRNATSKYGSVFIDGSLVPIEEMDAAFIMWDHSSDDLHGLKQYNRGSIDRILLTANNQFVVEHYGNDTSKGIIEDYYSSFNECKVLHPRF
jgi:hypothetical protein